MLNIFLTALGFLVIVCGVLVLVHMVWLFLLDLFIE